MGFREANKNDVKALADLVGSLAHFYLEDRTKPLPTWFSDTIQPSSFTSRILNPKYLNLVFEEKGLIEGYISIKNASHLYHLFVAEDMQGQGIATQLWQRAMSYYPESQHYTLRSSLFAVPFYLKLGFYKTGSIGVKEGIGFQAMEFNTKPY